MPVSFPDNNRIKTAVITGGHSFDVPGFHAVFRSMTEVDFYPQSLDNFVDDAGKVRDNYDALVFFNMQIPMPDERTRAVLEKLGESDQGIVVLHHALLDHEEWDLWSDIVGIKDRSIRDAAHGVSLPMTVVNTEHPITKGMSDFEIIDETYLMDDPGEGSDILLTTEHDVSMKNVAWARQFRNARVFCYQSGHDNQTYVDPNFRKVLESGIHWVAGRLGIRDT
jgi:type 1 glutamine amidotransferase